MHRAEAAEVAGQSPTDDRQQAAAERAFAEIVRQCLDGARRDIQAPDGA